MQPASSESFDDRYDLAVLVHVIECLGDHLINIAVRVVIHLDDDGYSDSDRERQRHLLRSLGRLSVALSELERELREQLFA